MASFAIRSGFALMGLVLVAPACGGDDDDDDGGGNGNGMQALAAQYCGIQPAAPANCPATYDPGGMEMICVAFASAYLDTPECRTAMQALIDCAPQRQYECLTGGEVPVVVAPDPCEPQTAPFVIGSDAATSGTCVDPNALSGA